MSYIKVKKDSFTKKYIEIFDSYDFTELISKYSSVETDLILNISNNISLYLKNSGCKTKGTEEVYKKGGRVFEKKMQFIEGERCLTILFPDFISLGTNKVLTKEINRFGLIKTVEFHYSDKIKVNFEGIFEIICTEITTCYDVLEIYFVRSSSDFSKNIYRSLHACFESLLLAEEKEKFIQDYFFLISDGDFGYCYFDDVSIRPVIKRLKKEQNNFYSPFQIMIWLVSSPFPFEKSISLESKKAGKEISELVSNFNYIDEFPRILRGVMTGLNSEDITVDFICQTKKYTLSITFPTRTKKEILPVISTYKELLENTFNKSIKEYSPLLRKLNSTTKIINQSQISDFASSVMAKIVIGLMKN